MAKTTLEVWKEGSGGTRRHASSTFEKLPAAIMLGRDVEKEVKIFADHMEN